MGVEGLREDLGRTITLDACLTKTRIADSFPDPAQPVGHVGVNAGVAPYLNEYPLPNGRNLGDGTALYSFQFNQTLAQNFVQGRVDYNTGNGNQIFARYTIDDADQFLPTDFPQFPRSFVSRNQFFTGEYRQVLTPTDAEHLSPRL